MYLGIFGKCVSWHPSSFLSERVTYLGIFGGVFHDIFPVFVYDEEEASLLGHLLHDVLWGEDGLQVEPLRLHLQPLVNRVLDT